MASRRFLIILACLPLSACAATQAETTPRSEPNRATSTQAPSWQPNALPQPVNRLGNTTSIAPAPAEPEQVDEPPLTAEPPAPQIEVETVTLHAPAPTPAPAPRPVPPQRPKPQLELPAPPQIPTSFPLPPEIQRGIDQMPTLPPLPRAEDIRIDVPL
ncbi:hypothetical protein I6J72_09770 [Corynebacterium sp. FDAARGOS 1242]|uniref:hypothetical protein n=1 Tax=Corynebacterium sp. FDAARGOS 1242 TaxID=2778078 RepID=UPI00194F91C3|nr:hypothetical protein [Corynebacterium sp. FDAARGOS 1242]QRP97451.1 hypothetical protein I6J72_09770 [Corynebacterium sp. FDAARGOS 1242]